MNIEELRDFCLSLKGVEDGFPFGDQTMVFKVMGKIFCIAGLDNDPVQFNAKCDPEMVEELRERYTGVIPGYHMNKKHWNTIVFDGSITNDQAKGWIVDSYELVAASLPKQTRLELEALK